MQARDDNEPTVRIRELRKDRVNFVLEHVDLACGYIPCCRSMTSSLIHSRVQIRQFLATSYDG